MGAVIAKVIGQFIARFWRELLILLLICGSWWIITSQWDKIDGLKDNLADERAKVNIMIERNTALRGDLLSLKERNKDLFDRIGDSKDIIKKIASAEQKIQWAISNIDISDLSCTEKFFWLRHQATVMREDFTYETE